ncbi:dihydroorotase [Parelusimicrobium proximum]|uniref:dihydroorotase n=1 Tax=Parelusimicrobium proximum TaxID=3228953 RepID=UPI003D16D46C
MKDILIKNARVIDPSSGTDKVCDVLVTDGKIKKVGENISAKDAEIIEGKGLICSPGFIDMHVHLREPGYEGKETIATGTLSAVKGGFTTVCMMPNTDPVMDMPERLALAKDIIKKTAHNNVEIIAAITKGRKGEALTDFAALKKAGAAALSDDGSGVEKDDMMRLAVKEGVKTGMLLISHAEFTDLTKEGVMHEGFIASKLGLKPISSASEYEAVRRDAEMAKGLDGAVHIAHISTKESCDIVRKAKKEGVRMTAEVTPHHFTLTDEECQSFDGNTKMNPPLRSASDVKAVKEAIQDGTIDAIATDHAPHASHEKEVEFERAMFGIIGLETALGLAVTELVDTKVIDLKKLIEMLSVNPAKILGLKKGSLKEGADADITLFDAEEKYVYTKEEILSMSKNTPFIGRELKGRVKYTIVNGKVAYKDQK